MSQEFITQHGKIAVVRDRIFITNIYTPLTQTAFAVLSVDVLWIALFCIIAFWPEDEKAKYLVQLIMWGIMLAIRLPTIYSHFFKTSWASRIPLQHIHSFEVIPDQHNLLTTVRLRLTSGRIRTILFRTKEDSLQGFILLLATKKAVVSA